jgi:signal transduction histidine kinase
MPRSHVPAVSRYAVAILAAAVGILLRWAGDQWWSGRVPFLTFFPAIATSAWYGGLLPGLLTTGLCAFAALWRFLSPGGPLSVSDPGDVVALGVFVGVGVVISALADETWRARAGERRRAEEARRSEERLRAAQASAGAGVWDWSAHTGELFWSEAYYGLCGLPRDTTPSYRAWLASILAEDRGRCDDYHRALVADPARTVVDLQYRIDNPERGVRWLRAVGRVERGPDGRATRVLGISLDVTSEVQAREAEQRARAEAEAASRAKDEFLAMLGHELRNPVGAIRSAVAILDEIGKHDTTSLRARQVIARQATHLGRLMDDLLDVGRVMAGKILLDREPLDLGEATQRAFATLAGRAERHHVALACESVWVDADGARIEQIVTNLIVNALKYTPAGGTVEISVRPEADTAVLTVRDTGVGIAPGLLPSVFDLFVQGERPLDRAEGGLGIGLTLVRQLVQLHGGTVAAESAGRGQGSTFTVRLPRIAALPVAAPRPAADEKRRRRVLLVEDNDDSREMLRVGLELAGHEVHEACDGPGGIEAARALRPDVAIVDVGLPGANGYEVARQVRTTVPGMKLIALTGYGQPEDRRRAMTAGFDTHLVKPVDPEQLLVVIAALTA